MITFPIMRGRRSRTGDVVGVPWVLVDQPARRERALRNHDQTIEVLARRGGLSPGELWAVVLDRSWTDQPAPDDADAWLEAHVATIDGVVRA